MVWLVFSVPMRNWNTYVFMFVPVYSYVFLACLWGIETQRNYTTTFLLRSVFSVPMRNWNIRLFRQHSQACKFLACLWGIETNFIKKQRYFIQFLACLWGIETTEEDIKIIKAEMVFSVPMRNWNPRISHLPDIPQVCF